MKNFCIFFLLLLPVAAIAQPPGYYLSATGLNGESLRIALKGIIRSHTVLTYTPGLWNAYYTTDVKPNGKVWDVYSDIPGGTASYEYTLGTNQCSGSSPTSENGCYNREHTWPQSKFASAAPMQTDLFIVYPTDYYVNSHRGDLPYGKVGTASQTFTNGSKIGNNVYAGAPSGNCFEPIDSFKGDLARTYFYISTCYRDDSAVFVSWEMANQVNFTPWTVQMLLEWHHMDPVSKKEIDRNNAAYALQNNRNPFIDHPEYADCIWGTGNCGSATVPGTQYQNDFFVYPNPANDKLNISLPDQLPGAHLSISILNISGTQVYRTELSQAQGNNISIPVTDWAKGMYFIQVITSTNMLIHKVWVD